MLVTVRLVMCQIFNYVMLWGGRLVGITLRVAVCGSYTVVTQAIGIRLIKRTAT